MRKLVFAVLIAVMIAPGTLYAQKQGSFVAGFDLGLSTAIGDFRDDSTLSASSGVGLGIEARYTLLNNISFGPFVKYVRVGSSLQSPDGNVSYNLLQYGGLLRLNLMNINDGKLFLLGGGGLFTPTRHTWTPEYVTDEDYDSDIFMMGGIGLCTNPYKKTIYEIEIRYNMAEATLPATGGDITSKFDFIYINLKISFNSKGEPFPRRY